MYGITPFLLLFLQRKKTFVSATTLALPITPENLTHVRHTVFNPPPRFPPVHPLPLTPSPPLLRHIPPPVDPVLGTHSYCAIL